MYLFEKSIFFYRGQRGQGIPLWYSTNHIYHNFYHTRSAMSSFNALLVMLSLVCAGTLEFTCNLELTWNNSGLNPKTIDVLFTRHNASLWLGCLYEMNFAEGLQRSWIMIMFIQVVTRQVFTRCFWSSNTAYEMPNCVL